MAFTKIVTNTGREDGIPQGVGFYHIDDMHNRHMEIRSGRCIRTNFPTGKYAYRVVFCDRRGAAGTTGWFLRKAD